MLKKVLCVFIALFVAIATFLGSSVVVSTPPVAQAAPGDLEIVSLSPTDVYAGENLTGYVVANNYTDTAVTCTKSVTAYKDGVYSGTAGSGITIPAKNGSNPGTVRSSYTLGVKPTVDGTWTVRVSFSSQTNLVCGETPAKVFTLQISNRIFATITNVTPTEIFRGSTAHLDITVTATKSLNCTVSTRLYDAFDATWASATSSFTFVVGSNLVKQDLVIPSDMPRGPQMISVTLSGSADCTVVVKFVKGVTVSVYQPFTNYLPGIRRED